MRNNKTRREQYAYSEEERTDIEKEWKNDNLTIQRYKGLGEMNPEQLRETVFVLPEGMGGKGKKKRERGVDEHQLTLVDFSQRDLRMVIDDVHTTRSLIERLMGSEVGPRKEWLMDVDWNEEE